MRIIQLVQDLKLGGLETLLFNMSIGLRDRGHQVQVVCLTGGGAIAERLEENGISVKIASINRVKPCSVVKLRRMLLNFQPDVVHIHALTAGTFGRIALTGSGVRTIYHLHTLISVAHKPGVSMIIRERWLAVGDGSIIAVSREVGRDYVKTFNIHPSKLIVISGGVPDVIAENRSKIRAELGLSLKDKVVICIASLTPHKRHDVLLEAVAKISGVILLLAGDGVMRETIELRIKRDDLAGRVHLLGQREDVHRLLSAADVFALSSYPREGLPLSVMEAFRASVPVVVTRVGGLPEVVEDGVNGYLVEPNNPEAMAKALIKLLEHQELREEMGKNARRRFSKHYELNRYLDRIESIYRR